MFNVKLHADSVEWSPMDFPGASLRVLHVDSDSGEISLLIHLTPGAVIPAHYHTQAAEALYVLEGDFIEAGVTSTPGTFYFAKAGVHHGPHTTVGGCTILITLSAELDVVLV